MRLSTRTGRSCTHGDIEKVPHEPNTSGKEPYIMTIRLSERGQLVARD